MTSTLKKYTAKVEKRALKEGHKEGREYVAGRMLEHGFSPERVTQLAGLPLKAVLKLRP